jgi:phosphohistidine phosphatase
VAAHDSIGPFPTVLEGAIMALYVVQHGKSLPKTEDPEKGLSSEGKQETERIAGVAKGYGVNVSAIFHSGKKRARETAELFNAVLRPKKGADERSGMNPLDDVHAFSADLRLDQDIMLVGHLPFLERLIGFLIAGDPDLTVFRLQNSGIVCLAPVEQTGRPAIRWALMPAVN